MHRELRLPEIQALGDLLADLLGPRLMRRIDHLGPAREMLRKMYAGLFLLVLFDDNPLVRCH